MHLGHVRTDDGVSPVIGVILMVAITVVLATIVAGFALGLEERKMDTAPNAEFEFDYDSGASTLEITHANGDEVREDRVTIKGHSNGPKTPDWTGDTDTDDYFSAGATYTATGVGSDDTVKVVWEGPNGDSTTLATWEQ
ncbi:type IV pilin [Haloglomus halophilum]|uniref:type IV pilin n=1 Tax=Haloglomus halophilum TaxID=2962672 RepID=UPI0020C9DB79|nr:type IV pilin N-terminal domain-containing protein [Haloglomus halophilum]